MSQTTCGRCGSVLQVEFRTVGGERTCPICLGPLLMSRPRPAPAPTPGMDPAVLRSRYADPARLCPICAEDRDAHAEGCPDSPEVLRITEPGAAPSPRRQVQEEAGTGSIMMAAWAILTLIGTPMIFSVKSSEAPTIFFTMAFLTLILAYFVNAIFGPGSTRARNEPAWPTALTMMFNLFLLGLAGVVGFVLFIMVSCSGRRY